MLHALELKLEDGCELYHVGAGHKVTSAVTIVLSLQPCLFLCVCKCLPVCLHACFVCLLCHVRSGQTGVTGT